MELFLIGHDCRYAVEQMLLTLFPEERPQYPEKPSGADSARITLRRGRKYMTAQCRLGLDGTIYEGQARCLLPDRSDPLEETRQQQRLVKLAFYRAALRSGRERPVWGALTGVRPARILSRKIELGASEKTARTQFIRENDVHPARADLCVHAARASMEVLRTLDPQKDVCLYVGIPFCPSRCAYCSFVSQDVSRSISMLPAFLEALKKEIEAAAAVVKRCGLRPVSVYIGGGTPTTLDETQLQELCTALRENFDLSACREFCVEAGRPDTITPGKLEVLRRQGVTRISVNPQSMTDRVLEAAGRRHTAQDVVDALETARRIADFDINMDLIAGLPDDTPEDFGRSLERVLALRPENITVHTLARKKGSRILLEDAVLPSPEDIGQMVETACRRLTEAGYVPYYLYRQKFMAGGFENVGWTLPGHANLYNLCIMEELTGILAMGGGASTKLTRGDGRIERLFTPKYAKEYCAAIDRVVSDKEKIAAFYGMPDKTERSGDHVL
ncbi:MAG: coproporphyrinogen dehydrogenase HemZ [Eubacteriales bacterium]|nr:coproporphyrinogen dehydrogenase HemZ [Eubacteriales bacterium]